MYLTRSAVIILPTGKEYGYQVGENDIESIQVFDSNITVTFKNRGPIVWIMGNIAGFSHDKSMMLVDEKDMIPPEKSESIIHPPEIRVVPPAVEPAN